MHPLSTGHLEIPITKGYVALIDECDLDVVSAHNWFAYTRKGNVYARAQKKIDGRYRYFLMHNLILKPPPGLVVDHANHVTLDNRRCNIRVCTVRDNNANRRASGALPFKGVYLSKGKFVATAGSPQRALGRFRTPEEAARAYDAVAKRMYGEFAYLNFPDEA